MLQIVRIQKLHTRSCLLRKFQKLKKPTEINIQSAAALPLSKDDISTINKMFMERTNGLEPEFEIKQLSEIRKEFNTRYIARYLEPSRKWYQYEWMDKNKPKHFTNTLINDRKHNNIDLNQFQEFTPINLMKNTLAIGDMVILSNNQTELSMCVALPESTKDPRYTFISIKGEMIFKSKKSVILRIPYNLPENVSRLVKRESLHGFTPIGELKNSKDETFIIPLLAKQLFTSPLASEITQLAWNKLPIIVKKLKLLHRYLNNSYGPKQIPFFQLCQMVEQLDLDKACNEKESISYITDLINCISQKPINSVNSTILLATYWAIQEQQGFNLWGKIHTSSALLTPISVTILPLKSKHYYYSQILSQMREKNYSEINQFVSLVNNENFEEVKTKFSHYLDLLRDYAAGNFHNNPQVIALISNMFRKIGKYKNSDISKDICQELIETINGSEDLVNPFHYNQDLNLPISSTLARNNQILYDIVNPTEISSKSDGQNNKRKDFSDLRVYCIDSKDAHEIDDGVSIKVLGDNKCRIYIHVADPASLFPESHNENVTNVINDEVLKVAFEKSFTSYLPDNVEPMFPQSFSKFSDLGKDGIKSKTITLSVEVSLNTITSKLDLLENTFEIDLGYVSNFPKATYNDVDKILDGSKSTTIEIQNDLVKLHEIAAILRRNRIHNDDAVIFGEGFNKGLVKLTKSDKKSNSSISFYDQSETPSSILVSEFMILANTLCGGYFKKNRIPGIFRCYNHLAMSPLAEREYKALRSKIKRGHFQTLQDIARLSSFLNSSFYSGVPLNHAMIGAEQYLTVTSPLRRFPDLVNHLQLHRYLSNKKLLFSQDRIDTMIWHIQSRADILKSSARSVNTYWTLKHLADEIKQDMKKTFDVIVLSVPAEGTVNCILTDYSFSRGVLKLKKDKKFPLIGDTIKNCKIVKILPIEGELMLEE